MNHARSGLAAALLLALALAGCGTARRDGPAEAAVGHYKLGKPYRINGRWYRPSYDPAYDRVGTASWYGADFDGLPTANGEVFDRRRVTAAHPTLPLPSIVRVTNLENGRSLTLRVNDRGPFVGDRLIDLSQAAARELGFERQGLARVRVQFVGLAEARGTPPTPTVAARARPRAVAAAPRPPAPRVRAVQVAALAGPAPRATAAVAPSCPAGGRFVQVGAFAETASLRAATEAVGGLHRVRVEPAFAGGVALARVRLGPVAEGAEARALLERVRALGYDNAFLTAADGGTLPC